MSSWCGIASRPAPRDDRPVENVRRRQFARSSGPRDPAGAGRSAADGLQPRPTRVERLACRCDRLLVARRLGRAGKKLDDALWAKFKAAGDVLFQAKAEVDAQEDEAYRANLTEKLALLDEAEKLLTVTDPKQARTALNRIQRSWDEIGRVPRDQVRPVEDRLRKVETHVRSLEDERWQREDPEKKARSEGMVGQLQDAIAKLEAELAAAEASGDQRAAAEAREALEARRSWLKAVGG